MESPTERVDLIVIGSGPAGYLPTILAVRNGVSIAIIEKSEIRGACLSRRQGSHQSRLVLTLSINNPMLVGTN